MCWIILEVEGLGKYIQLIPCLTLNIGRTFLYGCKFDYIKTELWAKLCDNSSFTRIALAAMKVDVPLNKETKTNLISTAFNHISIVFGFFKLPF